jgi:hypothetical protein
VTEVTHPAYISLAYKVKTANNLCEYDNSHYTNKRRRSCCRGGAISALEQRTVEGNMNWVKATKR